MDYAALLKALWLSLPRQSFAAGGEVDTGTFPMPKSLSVEGVGEIALPLSAEDFLKLKGVCEQAPFGKGEDTILDTDVRRAWQVDASKVSSPKHPELFTQVVEDLASSSVAELGIDAASLILDVKLYKLLLYEQGGHFKPHRDTEKEDGMFATMILQLPTEAGHQGGDLEICHGNKSVNFTFSERSTSTYFRTLFFCDCEHRLAEVTSGNRLCLVFSLVRNNATFIKPHRIPLYLSAISRVQSLLTSWVEQNKTSEAPVLVIPLGHKYSNKSLSFAGLKSYDQVVAGLVMSCSSFLEIHLCMLTKCTSSYKSKPAFSLDNWTAVDDTKVGSMEKCSIGLESVLRKISTSEYDEDDDPFDAEPDDEESEPYYGNDGGNLDRFYHTAALVVWPVDKRVDVVSTLQMVPASLGWLDEQLDKLRDEDPEEVREHLRLYTSALARLASRQKKSVFCSDDFPKMEDLNRLLELCLEYDDRETTFFTLKQWGGIVMKNIKYYSALNAAVEKYGWNEIEELLPTDACKKTALLKWLHSHGLSETAIVLAKKLVEVEKVLQDESSVTNLVRFFVSAGAEEEVWYVLSKTSTFSSSIYSLHKAVAGAVEKWREKSLAHVDGFWTRKLEHDLQAEIEKLKASANSRRRRRQAKPAEIDPQQAKLAESAAKRRLLGELASFALELEERGCYDEAWAYMHKSFMQELYDRFDGSVCGYEAVMLLCTRDERFHELISRGLTDVPHALPKIRKAHRLIGNLREDDKVKQLLSKLSLQAVKNSSYLTVQYELMETIFWMGDENVIAALINKLKKEEHLFREGDCDNFTKAALAWEDAESRKGYVRLVEERIRYLSREPTEPREVSVNAENGGEEEGKATQGEEEGKATQEEEEGKATQEETDEDSIEGYLEREAKKRRMNNPRVQRVFYQRQLKQWKNVGDEIQRLRSIITSFSSA